MIQEELCIDKKSCNGCGMCSFICANSAISLKTDQKGFVYPSIDTEKCINCGLCIASCPQKNVRHKEEDVLIGYAVKSRDSSLLDSCTSGGAFGSIVDWFFSSVEKPVIYGCMLEHEHPFRVKHSRCDNRFESGKFHGSKYVQSDMSHIYDDIYLDLQNGRTVLFSGTPCQVAGVLLAFHKWHQAGRLFLVDIICHAIPSPLIFSEHLSFISKKYNKEIVDYKFRSKEFGWGHREIVYFSDSSRKTGREIQRYKELFYKDIIVRESCSECKYCEPNKLSDITIGDYWGIEKVNKSFYDKNGVSFVIVQSEMGKRFIDEYSENLDIIETPVSEGFKYNHSKPISLNPKRDAFWNDFNLLGYKRAAKKYTDNYYVLIAKFIVRKLFPEQLRLAVRKKIKG